MIALSDLTAAPPLAAGLAGLEGLALAGLTADSREVRPGFLFAALPGSHADGRDYIPAAIGQGAAAILAVPGTVLPEGAGAVRLIEDAEPRRRFARLAAAFFGRQPATVVAVTGTNGKTSTVHFARQIWQALGCRAASLGTLGLTAPGIARSSRQTTPDPVALHRLLAELDAGGITHLAMEASSHGLDQFRLDGVDVAAAGFTTLGRDHLDYHGTQEAYLAAKARLFDQVLRPGGVAVLNADSPEFGELAPRSRAAGRRVMGYGRRAREIRLDAVTRLPEGQRLDLDLCGRSCRIELPLVGSFQAYNALCALGLVLAGGADEPAAVAALEHLAGVHGRLERVARHPNGAPVYVDYAHTPDALETVLGALRPHTTGRLVVVFGCGGDRDRGKRPVMGAVAARLADRVIVTDDNPRTEVPASIRAQILGSCPGAVEIGDRAEAIAAAIAELGPHDVLVIAGKGHETGQTIGDLVRPFDDADQARLAVAALQRDGS